MSSLPQYPVRVLADDSCDRLEARGSGGFADEPPVPEVFPEDQPTDADLDAMWAEEMARRDREAAAVFGDDPDPDRPGGAALPADALTYPASAARYSDAELITAVTIGDEEPHVLHLDPRRRRAWLDAMTAELLVRLERRAA
jgi:hypothetical protein